MTMIFGSSSWSMCSPISSVISSTMLGSCCLTRSMMASLSRGGRFVHSCGCWRIITPSTISGTLGAMIDTMCSPMTGGSRCW